MTAGSGCAKTGAGPVLAATPACFAPNAALQPVSVSHSGIPAQQQTNNSASRMFSQNRPHDDPSPVIGFGGYPARGT